MNTENPINKLRFDLLNEELKSLYVLENWGTTLFLSAIALLTKQLVDWSAASTPASTQPIVHGWGLHALPGVLGLVAFVFLRIINYRIRRVRLHLYASVQASPDRKYRSLGLVGWMMAAMPLALGLRATWYFSIQMPGLIVPMYWIGTISLLAALWAIYIFIRQPTQASKR